VTAGPVSAIAAEATLAAHLPVDGRSRDAHWLAEDGMILGLYNDGAGGYGVLAEERERVFGPRAEHVICSGAPGSGKSSLFLSSVIALFAGLRRRQERAGGDATDVPAVAALALNVKGGDLLFVDHPAGDQLRADDRRMWGALGVDPLARPFGRVRILTPCAHDGRTRLSLRANPAADVDGYSETHVFSLSLGELWSFVLDTFFDGRSPPLMQLLAELRASFTGEQEDASGEAKPSFTLRNVLRFIEKQVLGAERRTGPFAAFTPATVRAVYQRMKALPSALGGLLDEDGEGSGLDILDDLRSLDMVIIDAERLIAAPADARLGDAALKLVTGVALRRLTEALTRQQTRVNHVIVFADELGTLAPAAGHAGVGEELARLARTARDRCLVLWGAGQFRSSVRPDLLKASSVHATMRTGEYELQDPLYATLTAETRARLRTLQPGETLLQFPGLRQPVFARMPRPCVLTGPEGLRRFPERPLRADRRAVEDDEIAGALLDARMTLQENERRVSEIGRGEDG
jgi:hypothetical protein